MSSLIRAGLKEVTMDRKIALELGEFNRLMDTVRPFNAPTIAETERYMSSEAQDGRSGHIACVGCRYHDTDDAGKGYCISEGVCEQL